MNYWWWWKFWTQNYLPKYSLYHILSFSASRYYLSLSFSLSVLYLFSDAMFWESRRVVVFLVWEESASRTSSVSSYVGPSSSSVSTRASRLQARSVNSFLARAPNISPLISREPHTCDKQFPSLFRESRSGASYRGNPMLQTIGLLHPRDETCWVWTTKLWLSELAFVSQIAYTITHCFSNVQRASATHIDNSSTWSSFLKTLLILLILVTYQ